MPRKRKKDKTQTWLIVILCLMIGGYFSVSESRAITQVYKIIVRMSMLFWISMIFVRLKGKRKAISFEMRKSEIWIFYILYLLLGLASFMWTSNLGVSMLQWIMTAESLAFSLVFCLVLLMAQAEGKADPLTVFCASIIPINLIFWVGSYTNPDLFYRSMRAGEEIRLGGWLMNPNELGMLAGVGAALIFVHLMDKGVKVWKVLGLVINLAVLALTTSRSSLIGLFAILGILVVKKGSKQWRIGLGMCMVVALPVGLQQVIFKAGGGVEEVMSMTGRLPFWTALLNEGFVREPWLGYGFMRINYTDTFQGVHTYPGRMTHNTFMQVLMNLGIVGIGLALYQFAFTIVGIVQNKGPVSRAMLVAIFIPITINSFTEFGVFGETNYGILFYQLIIGLLVFKPILPESGRLSSLIETPKALAKTPQIALGKPPD